MKKGNIFFGLVIFILGVIYFFWNPVPRPVVAFLPHQDDEMFMGGMIQRWIRQGRPMYVGVVTDGAASSAQARLNGGARREGYEQLNDQVFAAARNREVFDSLTALGVPSNQIFFANPGGLKGSPHPKFPDGELTRELALRVIKKYYALVGDGTYVTVAGAPDKQNHIHGDHFALRTSLSAFDNITDKYYFSEHAEVGRPIRLSRKEQIVKELALKNYFIWSPRDGRFAVGQRSVGDLITRWGASGVEYMLDDVTIRQLATRIDK